MCQAQEAKGYHNFELAFPDGNSKTCIREIMHMIVHDVLRSEHETSGSTENCHVSCPLLYRRWLLYGG